VGNVALSGDWTTADPSLASPGQGPIEVPESIPGEVAPAFPDAFLSRA
jgi:hypothetical protein